MRAIGYLCGIEIIHSCQIEKEKERLRKWEEDERLKRNNRRKRKPKVTPHVPYSLKDAPYSGPNRNVTGWFLTKSTLHQRYDDSEILVDLFRYGRRKFDLKYISNIFDEARKRAIKCDQSKCGGAVGLDKFHLIEVVQSLILAYAEDVNMDYVMDRLKPNRKKKPQKKSLANHARDLLIERLTMNQEGVNESGSSDNQEIDEILNIWIKGIDWKKALPTRYDTRDFFMYIIREEMKRIKGADFDFDDLEERRPILTRQEMASCWRAVSVEAEALLKNSRKCRLPASYLWTLMTVAELAYGTLTSIRSNMSVERKGFKSYSFRDIFTKLF